jgi:hypothetical protein
MRRPRLETTAPPDPRFDRPRDELLAFERDDERVEGL